MKKKLDVVLKIIVSLAIVVTLFMLTIPGLQDRGILKSDETAAVDGMGSGMPAGGPPSGAGGQRPSEEPPAAGNTASGAPSDTSAAASGGESGQRPSGERPSGERPSSSSSGASPDAAELQGRAAAAQTSSRAQAVEAVTAELGTVSKYLKVNGDIQTDIEIDIYPDAAGKIIRQDISVGDYVRKGDIISVVDPSLPGQNFAESDVYSTISGTVLSVNARVGDKVSTSSSVITVGDLSELQLVTYIPEKYAGSLRTGLSAEAVFAAWSDEEFHAVITDISPVVDPTSRAIEISLDITDGADRIKTGMFAAVKLVTEEASGVVAIPSGAVFTYYDKDAVFVVKEDNTVVRREVGIGLRAEEMVEILSGITVDEVVVTEGQSLLNEGTLVSVVGQE